MLHSDNWNGIDTFKWNVGFDTDYFNVEFVISTLIGTDNDSWKEGLTPSTGMGLLPTTGMADCYRLLEWGNDTNYWKGIDSHYWNGIDNDNCNGIDTEYWN